MSYKLYQGDCLEVMPRLEDKSVDMILCDLPYGTTACKWDTIIPFEPLWNEYERLIKDNGAIVLTASQPFTSQLVMSNPMLFKYSLVWKKSNLSGFLNANRMPLRCHEDILLFYKELPNYNPQMTDGKPYIAKRKNHQTPNYGDYHDHTTINEGNRFPVSILEVDSERGLHPTQKPVKLFEYLIKTYTNEGDLILDNCAGSGTTGVAASNLNRNSILIEQEPEYCEIIRKRMKETEALRVEQRRQKTLMDFEGQTKLNSYNL